MQQVAGKSVDCLSVGILVADHLCDPIDHVPRAGELVLSSRLPLAVGGCASNVGIDLAKLGVGVGVVGRVGADHFGRFLIESLASAGVDTRGIRTLDDVETSGTLIINVRGEDRRFVHCVGANAQLAVADIPLDRVKAAKVLYVGGYLLMPALEGEPLAVLFRAARAAGVKTVLDIVMPGPGDHMAKLGPVLAETDLFLPNTDEAALLTGLDDPVQQAERFAAAGAGAVVITCGDAGSVLVSGATRLRAGAYSMPYQGGTGAGDAFVAGAIAGVLAGEDLAGALRWGSAVGASCVRSVSATDGVFTRAEAEEFLRANPLALEPL
jgi:sugar/nucleoside kinase (ribokinase family)